MIATFKKLLHQIFGTKHKLGKVKYKIPHGRFKYRIIDVFNKEIYYFNSQKITSAFGVNIHHCFIDNCFLGFKPVEIEGYTVRCY